MCPTSTSGLVIMIQQEKIEENVLSIWVGPYIRPQEIRLWAKLPSVGEICDFGRKMGEIMYIWTFLYWVLQALKRCFTLSRVSNVQIMQKHLITYICDVFFDETQCYPYSGLVLSGIRSLFSFCLAYLVMVLLNGHTLSV